MSKSLSIALLTIVAVITAFAIYLITLLKFDYDFEKFFPHDHEETIFYHQFRTIFESDNDFVIICILNDEGIFQQEFLQKVDTFASRLGELAYVEATYAPTSLKEVIRDPLFGGMFNKPVLRINEPSNYSADSVRIYNNQNYAGNFFSLDRKTVAIHMKHTQGLSKARCDQLSYDIEDLLNSTGFDEFHVIGRCIGQRIYVDMMVSELIFFVSVSAALAILFLFIAFRSFWNVVLPTLVVIISVLWTLGAMKLIGKDIDIMLTVLPTIIFVVGVSDSVHILTRYIYELRNGKTKVPALIAAVKDAGPATFLTALTSAIGFGTMVFNSIRPIADFGIYTAMGVMIAFVVTYIMLPAALLLVPVPNISRISHGKDFWTIHLHNGFRLLIRYRKKILIISAVIVLVCASGIFFLEANNYMLEDLREDHFLKKEFRFAEEKFSGGRPFEMAIVLNDTVDPFNKNLLHELDKLDGYLRNEYQVGNMVSSVTLIKEAWRTLNGGVEDFYSVPDDPDDIRTIEKLMNRKDFSDVVDLFINKEARMMRFSGKLEDVGRQYYKQKDRELSEFYNQSITPGYFTYKLTGTATLIDLNNTYLTENMLSSLFSSILIIGALMGLIYRSVKVAIIALIPNILPLVMVAGLMGFFGIHIKVSTSIIFNIAFGIAVDDTIHYLVNLNLLLRKGYTLPYASKRAMLTTGKAIIVTTLILCGGFVTLIFSDFMGTFYIGLLIGMTLILALVADLVLTPLLMLLLFRPKKNQASVLIEQPVNDQRKHNSAGHG